MVKLLRFAAVALLLGAIIGLGGCASTHVTVTTDDDYHMDRNGHEQIDHTVTVMGTVDIPISLPELRVGPDPEAVHCLASTLYGEARGEGETGMLAVADVVLNRVAQSGQTVCEVVSARSQFSGYGKDPDFLSVSLAERVLTDGEGRGLSRGADHFVAVWCHPRWRHRLRRTVRIGGHVFYVSNAGHPQS